MKSRTLTWVLAQVLNLNESTIYLFKKKKSNLENYVRESANHATIGFGFARMVVAKVGMCKEGGTYTPGE